MDVGSFSPQNAFLWKRYGPCHCLLLELNSSDNKRSVAKRFTFISSQKIFLSVIFSIEWCRDVILKAKSAVVRILSLK